MNMAAVQQDVTVNRNEQVAKSFADAGLPVFPCRAQDEGDKLAKSPLTFDGFKSATTDLSQIAAWWERHPTAVVGIPTGSVSGISVLDGDIDRSTGEAIGERQLGDLGLCSPLAVKVRTQSGGVQFLFAHVEGAKTSSHQVATNVDTRGEGGYIIAPGSVMANGGCYQYEGRKLSEALLAGNLPNYPVQNVESAIAAEKERKRTPPTNIASFHIATGHSDPTNATDAETLDVTRALLSGAQNTLAREDWVKLAMSLRVAFGEALKGDFMSFSMRYSGGEPCGQREAEALWASAGEPSQITSIAPALALLKDAVGQERNREVWREVLSRRDDAPTFALSDAPVKGGGISETEWASPDQSIIRPERPPAPEMTTSEFDAVFGPWASWLRSAAEVKGAHVDFVSLALLSTASAVIGNTRWAVPWEGWKEPPIIWGMLIGDPSAGKSPALDAILDPVKQIDNDLSAEYLTARKKWADKDESAKLFLAKWKSDAKAAIAEGDEPPLKPKEADAGTPPIRGRIRITDTTTEKAANLMSDGWRGLLLSRDELSGWLGSMDRYSGGGDRPFWLEAYGGRSFTVDRKNSPEPVMVDHLSIAILGGTQPDKLDSLLLHSDDDGLLARFLTVYPAQVPLRRPTATLDTCVAQQAMERLRALEPVVDENGEKRPFFLHLDEQAQDALQAFREQCREWEAEASGLMKSHIGKMPGMAVRVATVLALLDYAIDAAPAPHSIAASHLGRACHYVGEHLRKHAHRAYGAASMPAEVRAASRIGEIIKAERLTQISTREIQRRGLVGLQSSKEVGPAFAVLQDAGWIALLKQSGPGRPTKAYAVNPHLGEGK